MYEHNDNIAMAAVCEQTRESSLRRLAQCPDSSRPMVAGGTLHGARLGDSPQPPTGQGQCSSGPQADVEGVCPSRCRHSGQQKVPRQQEQLASLGHPTSNSRQSLHPQNQTPMVETPAPRGPVSTENVLRLLEHQRYRCALTGRSLTPQTAALDHIVPVRFGGEHLIENAQVLHKDVNRAKGSLTSDEFIGLCREVVRWFDSSTSRKDLR